MKPFGALLAFVLLVALLPAHLRWIPSLLAVIGAGLFIAYRRNQQARPRLDEPPSARPTNLAAQPAAFTGTRTEKKAERQEFEALAIQAAHGDPVALEKLPAAVAEARNLWRGGAFDQKLTAVLTATVRDIMADDVLTDGEMERLMETSKALGVGLGSLPEDAREELTIGLINAGCPPELDSPSVILRGDETAYAEAPAALMKTITKREFRGGSQGLSIPLGGGVRYRVGAMRGRSVVVGTELVAEDTGVLTVTSKRAVFTGSRKTLEFRRDKLVGLEQFKDGLRLNVSNRQTASLFKIGKGGAPVSVLAALMVMTPV